MTGAGCGTRAGRRKVLIAAYYFPPLGLSGVQRCSKFVKYLPDFGWDPVVLTAEPGGYFAFDQHLLEEVEERGIEIHRTRSLDPTRLFRGEKAVDLPTQRKRRLASRLSQWFMVPDNKVGWMPFATRAGKRLLRERDFSAVLSSAPPYSSHLVASRLSRRFRLPLVVDYRDDWLENPRHHYPTGLHRSIHSRMEARVGAEADAVVTINERIASNLHRRLGLPVTVIPQGFDPEDYSEAPSRLSTDRLEFIYTGVFYDRQSPVPFLEGLSRLVAKEPALWTRLRATFVGLFPQYAEDALDRLGCRDLVDILPYASHREAMRRVSRAGIPWLTVGSGPGQSQISTGKLYAYMGARKPILGIVPEGAAAETLRWYESSWIAHPDNPEEVDLALTRIVRLWLEGRLPAPAQEKVQAHDRRRLAGKLAAVLDRVAS